jgi:hypothetical protein
MPDGSKELPGQLQDETQTAPQSSYCDARKIAENRIGEAQSKMLPTVQDDAKPGFPEDAVNHSENAGVHEHELVTSERQHEPQGSAMEEDADEFPPPRSRGLETLIDAVALATHEEVIAAGDLRHEPDEPDPGLLTPLIDLVRRDSDDPRINVCLFQSVQQFRYSSAIEYRGRMHRVPVLPPGLRNSLPLPTAELSHYGSTRELFDSISALFQQHALVSEKQNELLTYWSIASWFPDFLPFVPRLTITGPPFAADLLLRVLRSVCRRPVLLAGMSPAILRVIPFDELMPTLLIREVRPSKKMAALLDASDHCGYFVASDNDVRQFYCAKCLYLGEDRTGNAGKLPGIHVHVGQSRWSPVRPMPSNEVTQDFQNRLFYYRALNHDHVESSKFGVNGFMPEFCAVAQALGAPIVNDTKLQTAIIELLRGQNEQARVDRASGLNAVVLRAVLFHCHEGDQQQAFVREITATVNQILEQEGESLKVSNETVGHVLKSLGLYTSRLGSTGRGLVLDKAMRFRAHELCYIHQVAPDPAEAPGCGHCHNLQVQQRSEVM